MHRNNDEDISPADWARVDEAIASATIALAHQLGLEVVGEGVETEFQKNFLEAQGCDLLQGHLLGRPMPREGVTRFIQDKQDRHTQGAEA